MSMGKVQLSADSINYDTTVEWGMTHDGPFILIEGIGMYLKGNDRVVGKVQLDCSLDSSRALVDALNQAIVDLANAQRRDARTNGV